MAAVTAVDPVAVALRVAGAFESHEVRYVLGGSMASTAFGEPRSTLDVDFAADLTASTLPGWAGELDAEFWINREWAATEIARRGSFQILHREQLVRVDVFVPPWQDLHLWKWENRLRLQLGDGEATQLDVTSPAGIVLQKLSWFQDSGGVSDRQWRDVVGVLKAQAGRLDETTLRAWSHRLGIEVLLSRALAEAGWLGSR